MCVFNLLFVQKLNFKGFIHLDLTANALTYALTVMNIKFLLTPCNINAYSTPEVMRIKGMLIAQGEFS